jgi:hypothetical protein
VSYAADLLITLGAARWIKRESSILFRQVFLLACRILGVIPPPPPFEDGLQGVSGASQAQMLVDLLRQVKPLCSKRPEDILRIWVRLDDIHALALADDRVFITRILPLVPAGLLQFLGACLCEGNNWAECKAQLLEEYFPHFVRESLI